MLMIRLQRVGKKNQPSFRVVVTDRRNSTKSGKIRETIGWYNPREHAHSIEKERVLHWLSKGAQASGTVHNMLIRAKIVQGKKVNVAPSAKKKEETAKPADGAALEAPAAGVEEKKESAPVTEVAQEVQQ